MVLASTDSCLFVFEWAKFLIGGSSIEDITMRQTPPHNDTVKANDIPISNDSEPNNQFNAESMNSFIYYSPSMYRPGVAHLSGGFPFPNTTPPLLRHRHFFTQIHILDGVEQLDAFFHRFLE